MPDLFCGNCGNLAKSLNNCGHCNGPVFDLSTPHGVIDCRMYRSMRLQRAQLVPRFYVWEFVAAFIWVLVMALGSWVSEFANLAAWATVGLGFLLIYYYFRWSRSSPERRLDARLERPDPFHDPRAPEPPRATRRPSTGAAL
jgi:hypothetical protein